MKKINSSPKSAAITGFILCLPIIIIFCLVILDIEPHFGPIQPLLIGNDGHLSTFIPMGAILLLPAAFIISVAPIRQAMRAGKGLLEHPVNLLLSIAILVFVISFAVGIIIDQYPCWTGIPNCD